MCDMHVTCTTFPVGYAPESTSQDYDNVRAAKNHTICQLFNRAVGNKCYFNPCKFAHMCIICRGNACTGSYPYKKTRRSIACCRPAFYTIFYLVTCLYFNLQTCENPVAVLSYRIVAGWFFVCGTVYIFFCLVI